MGHSKTELTVAEFSKDKKGKKSIVELDYSFEDSLGGRTFDKRLSLYFVDQFSSEQKLTAEQKQELLNDIRSMTALSMQAKKAKEILSVNKSFTIKIDRFHQGKDFKAQITRDTFQDLIRKDVERVMDLFKAVQTSFDEIEFLGGSFRIPLFQQEIKRFAQKNKVKLSRTLNADEAPVMGSALKALNHSSAFRMRQALSLSERNPWSIDLFLGDAKSEEARSGEQVPGDASGAFSRIVKLFDKTHFFGKKRTVSLKVQKDLYLRAYYKASERLPAGQEHVLFEQRTNGIQKLVRGNGGSEPVKVSVTFELGHDGVLSIPKIVAKFNRTVSKTEIVSVGPINGTDSNSTIKSDPENESENVDESVKIEETKASGKPDNEQVEGIEEPETVRVEMEETIPLSSISLEGKLRSEKVIRDDIAKSKKILAKFEKRDRKHSQILKAKNDVEEYLNEFPEMMNSAVFGEYSTAEELKLVKTKLLETTEWFHENDDLWSAEPFESHLSALKNSSSAVISRLQNAVDLRKIQNQTIESLSAIEFVINNTSEDKKWIPQTEIESFRNETNEFKAWLKNASEASTKTPLNADPVLSSKEVADRINALMTKANEFHLREEIKAPQNNSTNLNKTRRRRRRRRRKQKPAFLSNLLEKTRKMFTSTTTSDKDSKRGRNGTNAEDPNAKGDL